MIRRGPRDSDMRFIRRVHWFVTRDRFQVRLPWKQGQRKTLGSYATIEIAMRVRDRALKLAGVNIGDSPAKIRDAVQRYFQTRNAECGMRNEDTGLCQNR